MFKEIFFFEIKYRLKRPATYIYFFLFFVLAFLVIQLTGGAFESVNFPLAGSNKVMVNSPYMINLVIAFLSFFGVIVIAAIMGNPVYRDYEYNAHVLFFTKPISKFDYLGGRFLGALVIAFLVMSSMAFGIMIGSFMPWLDASKVGAFHLMYYIQPYLVFVLPNMIFIGAFFFTLATTSRNMLSVYVGSVAFLVLYGISKSLLANLSNETLSAMMDPFGGAALHAITKYWTVADKNTKVIPLTGLLMTNRVIWLIAGMGIFGILFSLFHFEQFSSTIRKAAKEIRVKVTKKTTKQKITIPQVNQYFSAKDLFKQYLQETRSEFSGIIKSIYFIAIVFAGLVFLFVGGSQVGKIYDTPTYPVTNMVVQMLNGSFYLFVLIIIIFYSGELVWKEREVRISQIYNALPVPNWVPFTSKLSALILVQVLLLFVVMICGMIIQIFYGYFNFQIGLYIKGLFGINLINYALMCVLAMFVQVLVNNKYVGYVVMVVFYIFSSFMGQIGLQHILYHYGSDPGIPYSALNGYGNHVWPFIVLKMYWSSFAVLLAVVSSLLWVRGSETNFKWRLRIAAKRFDGKTKLVTGIALIAFLGIGSYIFYNTNILNKYTTTYESELEQANFEKTYKKYEHVPQPRVTAVHLNVNIYPKTKGLTYSGYYVLKNKTSTPIDSIHVLFDTRAIINQLGFNKSSKKVLSDKNNGYYIYRLGQALMPGDTIVMNMNVKYVTKGFTNDGSSIRVAHNGTFFTNQYMPNIGYNPQMELSDNDIRKKFGLPYKRRMAPVNDSIARMNTYVCNDADWMRFDAIVSTSGDQTALTSGQLIKKWTKCGRNYFHYKMSRPIENFYAFFSGRYQVKKEHWKNIPISIYYHKGHDYNLNRMFRAIKDGLTYYTKNYSPYQFKQIRIIEFPGFAAFAQSFSNTIAFSESIGFVADVDDSDPSDIDYPYYVTAHELAHQWWAHQVIGGNVDGCTMLSESMAQYSAMMIMKHRYGANKMKKFLKYEMDRYLRGRASESEKEPPLYLVENQPYIHYRKGSVVMYALQDYIGEARLDSALRKYIKAVAYQEPPYTNSIQFLKYINAATPDSLKYIINDMFKTITLYDNKVDSSYYEKTKDGKYIVHLKISAKKLRADSLGNQKTIPIHDWIDIGVFAHVTKNGHTQKVPVYLKKRMIDKEHMTFDITVDKKPYEAGIDPYNKLIDRRPGDNLKTVMSKKG